MNTVDIGEARRVMAGSGPEDLLVRKATPGVKIAGGEDLHTAATAGSVILPPGADTSRLVYKSVEDVTRYAAIVSSKRSDGSGPGDLIADVASKRMLTAKADYAHELTLDSTYAHRAAEEASSTRVQKFASHIKVARAMDTVCRWQYVAYQTCRDRFGAAFAANCTKEALAYEECIEEF